MKKIQKLFLIEMEIDDECDEYYEDEIDIDETDINEMFEEYVEVRGWENIINYVDVRKAWIKDGKLCYWTSTLSEESAKRILEIKKEMEEKRKQIA